MSDRVLTIPEMALEPSGANTGDLAVDYRSRTLRQHAIRVTDDVGEPTTLCGEFVHGELLNMPFEATPVPTRCARCADLLDLPHAGP